LPADPRFTSIQIWEVCDVAACGNNASVPLPRMVLALGHMAGLTWHCRWCPIKELGDAPGAALPPGATPRLGLLAAALGDGTVQVWAVPRPEAVTRPPCLAADAPSVIHPMPLAAMAPSQLGGSLPSLVDWMPTKPFDQLLVGCWDGSVVIAKLDRAPVPPGELTGGASLGQAQHDAAQAAWAEAMAAGGCALCPPPPALPSGMSLLAHFPVDTLPLRAVRWLPDVSWSIDNAERHTFLAAGHEGVVKIWDARDQFQPAYALQLTSGTILDASWTMEPLGLVAALEDGSLRSALLSSTVIEAQAVATGKASFSVVWRGTNSGALWAVEVHPVARVVAYAGEDGVVGVATGELKWDNRKRRAHTPVGVMQADAVGGLVVKVVDEMGEENAGLFRDRVVDRASALAATLGEVPREAQAVRRLAWAPHAEAGLAWLAAATEGGVVRCQFVRIRSED
jgi:general transcription factor 3C polypeptide 2